MVMVMFKRWAICYAHDNSPVDGKLYTHKFHADKELLTLANQKKLVVKQIEIKII